MRTDMARMLAVISPFANKALKKRIFINLKPTFVILSSVDHYMLLRNKQNSEQNAKEITHTQVKAIYIIRIYLHQTEQHKAKL